MYRKKGREVEKGNETDKLIYIYIIPYNYVGKYLEPRKHECMVKLATPTSASQQWTVDPGREHTS